MSLQLTSEELSIISFDAALPKFHDSFNVLTETTIFESQCGNNYLMKNVKLKAFSFFHGVLWSGNISRIPVCMEITQCKPTKGGAHVVKCKEERHPRHYFYPCTSFPSVAMW